MPASDHRLPEPMPPAMPKGTGKCFPSAAQLTTPSPYQEAEGPAFLESPRPCPQSTSPALTGQSRAWPVETSNHEKHEQQKLAEPSAMPFPFFVPFVFFVVRKSKSPVVCRDLESAPGFVLLPLDHPVVEPRPLRVAGVKRGKLPRPGPPPRLGGLSLLKRRRTLANSRRRLDSEPP